MGVCFARHSRWTRGHWRLLDCEAPDCVRFGDVAGSRHRPWTVLSGIGWRSRGLRSAWLVSGQPVATQRSVSATPAVRQLVLRELSETVIPANRSCLFTFSDDEAGVEVAGQVLRVTCCERVSRTRYSTNRLGGLLLSARFRLVQVGYDH